MSFDKTKFELVRHSVVVRRLTVIRTERLSRSMVRVTLGGEELEGFTTLSPEDHVRAFFPEAGRLEPLLPKVGPMNMLMPTLTGKPVHRDYTPRRYDPERRELVIDFHLHGDGVASRWAAAAEPGHVLGVAGPRGSYVLKIAPKRHLFIGDETAIPEMSRRIEELGEGVGVEAWFQVGGPDDELPVPTSAVRWLHREAEQTLGRAGEEAELSVDTFAWIAGEAGEVRAAVRALVARGHPKEMIHASGHWKRGVTNHDHHEPVEARA